jgi:ATP-dependent Clp protease ATP-binding subunit ClpA
VLEQIKASGGNILLFIDELHTIVGAGKTEGSMDAGNLLKPMLARGELHCIGATTLDEYRQYIEKDAALERRFQPVMVEEPTVEDTISILRGLKERYEIFHGVRIHDNALVAAATLSNRYITDRFLPDKAIDLVDEACAMIRTEIDSMPAELDDLRRRMMQLEIEEMALKKENDALSKERYAALQKELADLKEDFAAMKAKWESEKSVPAHHRPFLPTLLKICAIILRQAFVNPNSIAVFVKQSPLSTQQFISLSVLQVAFPLYQTMAKIKSNLITLSVMQMWAVQEKGFNSLSTHTSSNSLLSALLLVKLSQIVKVSIPFTMFQ